MAQDPIRTFLAIELSEAIRTEAHSYVEVIKQDYPDFRFIPPENWHLTLHFFGRIDSNQIQKLKTHLPPAFSSAQPFSIQLEKLDKFNDIRIKNADNLTRNLNQFEKYFQLPTFSSNTKHTFYGYVIVIKPDAPFRREELINYLENNLIETRPFLGGCLPDQPAFRKENVKVIGNLSVSRHIRDNAFFIGCHPGIGKDQIDYVTEKISSFIKKIQD